MPIEDEESRFVSFIGPWNPVYIAFCVAVSVLPFFIGFLGRLSVSSDLVFGFYVIIGGCIGDVLFQKAFKRTMVLFPGVQVRIIYFWPMIGLVIMLLRPFE